MPNMLFANNCNTTLNGGITAVATSMVVTSATGFPVPTGAQYFYCTLADAATQTTIEIVKVTAVSGTTFTIVRGQDGTTGTIFASGAVVSLRLVAASLNDFPKLDEDNTFTGILTANSFIPSSSTVPTNGLYLPAANSVGFATNSTERMRIDSSGNLGLGTASPSGYSSVYKQLIIDGGANPSMVQLNNTTTGSGINTGGLAMIQSGNDSYLVNPKNSFIAFFTNNAAAMRLFASGGLSIGNTTDPGATNLSVTGSLGVAATVGLGGGKISTLADLTAVNGLVVRDSATTYGNTNNFVLLQNSTGGTAGALTHTASQNLGVWSVGAIQFLTNTGATEAARIFQTGGVSIGNTTDKGAASLNVSGLIYPQQAATASAPAYQKGAIYFDTTLNKLRVGGATAWETITSV